MWTSQTKQRSGKGRVKGRRNRESHHIVRIIVSAFENENRLLDTSWITGHL